jgi:hypothetical protein
MVFEVFDGDPEESVATTVPSVESKVAEYRGDEPVTFVSKTVKYRRVLLLTYMDAVYTTPVVVWTPLRKTMWRPLRAFSISESAVLDPSGADVEFAPIALLFIDQAALSNCSENVSRFIGAFWIRPLLPVTVALVVRLKVIAGLSASEPANDRSSDGARR